MPFKRYQVQPVWRADRPQKGRFREFYQCDVDVVGTASMAADAECLAVVHAALRALGFREFTVKLNHRRILRAVAESAGVLDRETSVLVAIDKLDKIGRDGVGAELAQRGIPGAAIDRIWALLAARGDEALDLLERELGEDGRTGVAELREVMALAAEMGADRVVVDPTLARGLNYYTGPVFETEVVEPRVGSISGGGRYDGLIGVFSGRQIPAR
jgi:histidyl-tRNA synthetase